MRTAPRAYGTHGKGLDALGNAGKPGHWWGIVTDNGKPDGTPVTQAPPLDDFYISPTALQDHRYGRTDPSRYVDSETVPYISLPGKGSLKGKHPNPDHRLHAFPSKLGDLAWVMNLATGLACGAIHADVGPAAKLGEGSICLARSLHIPPSPRHGGVTRNVLYVVFSGSGHHSPLPPQVIQSRAEQLFKDWGGIERLIDAMPEHAQLLRRASKSQGSARPAGRR